MEAKEPVWKRESGKSGQSVATSLLPGTQRSPWLPLQACNDVCF
ncbi:rCG28952 [Rattus norvegicus]|uniref:RCG28952 n=1 Tax=Rattus norvegicus TaxID=10116 RepID=A6HVV4_RAT|nr:rCG28952 [Rattus norvegicus]